jgi:hypothetical protein
VKNGSFCRQFITEHPVEVNLRAIESRYSIFPEQKWWLGKLTRRGRTTEESRWNNMSLALIDIEENQITDQFDAFVRVPITFEHSLHVTDVWPKTYADRLYCW